MNRGPFRVSYSGALREELLALLRKAERYSIYQPVSQVLSEIEGHLELDPENWGDPLCDLKGLQLRVYRRVYEKLSVNYAVHEFQATVFLLGIAPRLGHPLADID